MVVAVAPTVITCYNFYGKLGVIFELFLQIMANIHMPTCLFPCQQTRHKFCSNPFLDHIFR